MELPGFKLGYGVTQEDMVFSDKMYPTLLEIYGYVKKTKHNKHIKINTYASGIYHHLYAFFLLYTS